MAAAGKVRNTFVYVLICILFFFATLYHHCLHPNNSFSFSTLTTTAFTPHLHYQFLSPPPQIDTALFNNSITVTFSPEVTPVLTSVSVLLPAWEVLVIVSPDDTLLLAGEEIGGSEYVCLYPNNDVSPAKRAGILTSPNRATFKCLLPKRSRRKLPFSQPILTRNPKTPPQRISPAPELLRWSYVVFDSLTTDDDVVIFAKGLNPRQGLNRDPSEFSCLFYQNNDVTNGVRTAVTISMQEIFRCKKPELTTITSASRDGEGTEKEDQIKVTLSTHDNHVVPTLAYYSPPPIRKLANDNEKSLLCACTMVYNAAKFLKEWVAYHSSIGIDKFIIYDNESNDNLEATVEDLNQQGFEIDTYFWLWPKAQESGFSHSAILAKSSCTWMAYIDVDEFIYSPSWLPSSSPSSKFMLHSLIPSNHETLGQINIGCYEFGPSNQTQHPVMGVTQGYDCRRKYENRHKSIVLIEAIDDSLLTVIHHFNLKPKYLSKRVGIKNLVVNHYKYQAWPEFKAKFRRRVSAYVVDWMDQVNPHSNDRTPGLGYSALEPSGWAQKFCEVHDYGLKELTGKWFGLRSPAGYRMFWQR